MNANKYAEIPLGDEQEYHYEERERGLGKRQRAALRFIRSVNGWHCFDGTTAREIKSLQHRGLVVVNRYRQFRAV